MYVVPNNEMLGWLETKAYQAATKSKYVQKCVQNKFLPYKS